jgi:GxxExxY protein
VKNETLCKEIIDAATRVYEALGPGFLESIYSRAFFLELKSRGFNIERERQIKIWYGSQLVGKHVLDLVVAHTAIIELKANHSLIPVHGAQLRSYLQATEYPFGVLFNFGTSTLQYEVLFREKAAENPE